MNLKSTLVSFLTALALAPSAFADFHLMQIEQVIAGLNGNINAQAIQLRMRATGENLVSQTRLRVWNSTGTQPVVVLNIDGNVSRFAAGSRVLLATQAFIDAVRVTSPLFTPDFIIVNPIPQGDLLAGRLTYETDQGFVMWSFAWGGNFYSGSNGGGFDNDANGNYGPPFAGSLPTNGRRGVRFDGPASAPSTNNAADYVLSSNPATVITNDGRIFVIGPAPEIAVVRDGRNLLDGVSKKDFGTVVVGERSTSETFTIANVGTTRLADLKLVMKGANPGDFKMGTLSKTSLLPDETVKFKVFFKPRATGTRKADLRIRSNDSDEDPFNIKLQGTGKAR
ncbi:MAG: choice-of-anchor D domain-containing protein [Verrucomicrobiota bacterium]